MSYILDALRRSQAERERGQVPGLGATQPPSAEVATATRGPAPAMWLGLGLAGGALLAAAAWWWWRPAATPPAAVTAAAAAAPVAAPPPAPAPVALPVVVTAPPPSPSPAPAPAPAPVPAAAAPAPPAAPARVPTLAELSPEQRRELPPLAMGGSIWSENAQSRFVIVNGQVVREGEPAAPGVTVERIAPKAVLLRFRELRFEIPL